MDPNETLRIIRNEIIFILDSENIDVQSLVESGQGLAELVRSLDEWIKKGGFLPNDWLPSVKSKLKIERRYIDETSE